MKQRFLLLIVLLVAGPIMGQTNEQSVNMPFLVTLPTTHVLDEDKVLLQVGYLWRTSADEVRFGWEHGNTNVQTHVKLMDRVQVGLSWEGINETASLSAKANWLQQAEGAPLNVSSHFAINANTALDEAQYPELLERDRLSYASLLLLSGQATDRLYYQLSPGYIRQNLVWDAQQNHDQPILGLGGAYQINSLLWFNLEYVWNLSRHEDSPYQNPLSASLKVMTNHFSVQLVASNAQLFNLPGYMANATGEWGTGNMVVGLTGSVRF